jgi:hypothetical protein
MSQDDVKQGEKTVKLTIYFWQGDLLWNAKDRQCWDFGTVNLKAAPSRGIRPRATGWHFRSMSDLPRAVAEALAWAEIQQLDYAKEKKHG